MANRRWSRTRKQGREDTSRRWRKRILVVCEGEITEFEYLKQFNQFHRVSKVRLDFARERGVPKTLVQIAKELKANSTGAQLGEGSPAQEFDEVWCVFDIDEHPHVSDAIQMARDNGIDLAISHPCFELWLLLHFRDAPGARKNDAVTELLCKHLPKYDKSVDFLRDGYAENYSVAVARAQRLEEVAEMAGTPGHNPTTGVYRLTESIRNG
jgi:hypothetical protein